MWLKGLVQVAIPVIVTFHLRLIEKLPIFDPGLVFRIPDQIVKHPLQKSSSQRHAGFKANEFNEIICPEHFVAKTSHQMLVLASNLHED